MKELILPHQAPLRFAKYVLSFDNNKAVVKNIFPSMASLGMLVEAAAQSSAAFVDEESAGKSGYITTLKNIKLLQTPTSLELDITISLTNQIEKFSYFDFIVNQEKEIVATGTLMVVIT